MASNFEKSHCLIDNLKERINKLAFKTLRHNKIVSKGVRYKNLVKSDLLVEIVKASEIRPVPPKHERILVPEDIRMYDIIDVFDNDGWWIGFICGRHEENYKVYFPTTGENVAYSPHLLRFHQEWNKGNWISSN
ncbi:hypothetical protein RDI58_009281 [Solanum bulbocastanum]|uniref:Agenet domain-containing protein n=1 Tax=Solanum bulbocastanum TaxID=147425 RepID=A0AAN8U236_SOLBU